MARPIRFRIRALSELHRQLGYAPDEARRRHMSNAERLLDELDRTRNYAASDIVHAITGYRPEQPDDAMLVGEALRADLAVFVQRLSETLDLAPEDRDGGAEPVEVLAARLGVTLRTVQRWRRDGLTLHHIRFADGDRRLGCYADSLARFESRRSRDPSERDSQRRGRRRDALRRDGPPPRIGAAERGEILRLAGERAEKYGDGLSAAALAAARRTGRSIETVRRLLRRHDAESPTPIFAPAGMPSRRLRRLIDRAWRWGVPAARIARHCGKGEPAVHRQLMAARRDRLCAMTLEWVELPTFALPDAETVILNAPPATSELRRLWAGPDTHATLKRLRQRPAVDDELQEARLVASSLLRRRVASAIRSMDGRDVPNAGVLDAVETDLRWALALLLTAIADELPNAIRRAESAAGRPAERFSGEALRQLFVLSVSVAAETLPGIDPSRRQRPSRRIALAIDKALARLGWEERRGRAVAVAPTPVSLEEDPCAAALPWQSAIDLPPRWPRRIDRLSEVRHRAVVLRHGLDGRPPRTMIDVGMAMGITPSHAARLVHEAETAMRRPTDGV